MSGLKVWYEPIHPLDGMGSLHFSFEKNDHYLTYIPVWFGCGETGVDIKCSCGYHTQQREGRGCWQDCHNESKTAYVDPVHLEMFLEIKYQASLLDNSELEMLSGEFRSLEVLAERVPISVLYALIVKRLPSGEFPMTYFKLFRDAHAGRWMGFIRKNPILGELFRLSYIPTVQELIEQFEEYHKIDVSGL